MSNSNQTAQTATGTGASAAEIGTDVASMLRSGTKDPLIWDKWWDADRITSVEGDGSTWTGRKGLEEKAAGWEAENEITSFEVKGPFVGASGFALHFSITIKSKSTGEEMNMDEVAVYTVENGKVVREEFMYSSE
ncbi:MAG: nuclear transport factor 2 family protein [Phycisphaerales bacterium JB065]